MAPRILHVEVGGTYGGSLRALELYLRYSERGRFTHDLLLYYPTPGTDALAPHVSAIHTLIPSAPPWIGRAAVPSRRRSWFSGPLVHDAAAWLRLLRQSRTIQKLCRLFQAGEYDVIHVNNTFPYSALAVAAARLCHIPAVAHIRNPVEHGSLAKVLGLHLDAIVAVSENYTREFRAWDSRLKVRTCYDGVEPPVPRRDQAQALRDELLGSGDILIGSAGRLDTQKGFADLIDAAALVCRACPRVRFAIAGDGSLRDSLQAHIRRRRLEGRFTLCGFRSDVANFLSAIDAYASSSLWEGLPISIVEAMLLGKPVVATGVGGVSELVTPDAGRLVPPGDVQALAAALIAAVHDLPVDSRRVSAASAHAAALSDPSRNAAELDAILSGCRTLRPGTLKEGSYVRTAG